MRARPCPRSWPLKQGSIGDISQLKEDLEQKTNTWQREVDLKLMKSVWGAHLRTPEEDELSEECVREPPRVCLCCHQRPHTLFSGCWAQRKFFCKVFELTIKGFRAAITEQTLFGAKNGRKRPFVGLKQCFWGLSGHR